MWPILTGLWPGVYASGHPVFGLWPMHNDMRPSE